VGKPEKRLAKAVGKVLARHVVTRAGGSYLPWEQFLREVTAEVVRDLDRRTAKNIQAALAAADQVMALTAPEAPGPAEDAQAPDYVPATLEADVAAQQRERDGPGPPLASRVPRWHPDHPDFGTGTRETE
jgi:hypothetical protein